MVAESTSNPPEAAAASSTAVSSTTATTTSAALTDTSTVSPTRDSNNVTATASTGGNVNSSSPTVREGDTAPGAGPGDQSNDNQYYPEGEEVLDGDWKRPQLDLKEVETKTGEEDEAIFWSKRAKLYRWDKAINEWKERGLGDAKLLKHRTTGKVRFLLRQEKTHKLMANHYVLRLQPSWCELKPNVGSDRIWVWTVMDSAEDPQRLEQFAIKFGQADSANEFKTKFEEAAVLNAEAFKDVLALSEQPQPQSDTVATIGSTSPSVNSSEKPPPPPASGVAATQTS